MSEHLSEQEQIETFKRWWKSNGMKAVMAVVAGVGLWYGWQQWQAHQVREAQQASQIYLEMMEASNTSGTERTEDQRIDVVGKANKLKSEHADSQYARYAAFMLAKLAVEQNDLDTAASELQWVLDSGADEGLIRVARLRLARVEAARGNHQRALDLLQAQDAGEMASAYAEVRGDIYMQQGDYQAAQDAYEEAISRATAADESARQLLELKLNRVSPAVAEATVPSAEEQVSVENQ